LAHNSQPDYGDISFRFHVKKQFFVKSERYQTMRNNTGKGYPSQKKIRFL